MSVLQPASITPEWLTERLHECALLAASGAVSNVRFEVIGEGAGMMSLLQRLHLSYMGDSSGPASLVVKSPAENETNRAVAVGFRTYEREARFFRDLAGQCKASTPQIVWCDVDEQQNFIIVMEDLQDYRLGDQVVGANLADTRVCLEELAKLHASFWQATDDLDWIPGIGSSYHAEAMQAGTEAGWPSTLSVFGDAIPAKVQAIIEPFKAKLPELQAHLLSRPKTLLHGDYRLENLFFGGAGQTPLYILDWQGPLQGRGIDEVAFFLAQNSQTEVRRAHEAQLVSEYVTRLGELGVTGYDEAQAWQDYRLAVLYNWCYVVVVSGTLDTSNAHAQAWMTQMVARNATAIDDLNCYEFL